MSLITTQALPLHEGRVRTTLKTNAPTAAPTWQAVLRRYQQHLGLAGSDEVASRLRGRVEQPVSALARWIVARDVLMLPCDSVLLLPLFQFDFEAGRVVPAVSAALSELRPVFDDWDLVSWFATPNALLDAAAPMHCIDHDPASVVEAARTDRFIAAG